MKNKQMPTQTFKPNQFELYSNLAESDNSLLFHEKHDNLLPHPADILSGKLDELTRAHTNLFEERNNETPHFINSLEHVKQFIYSIDGFYDSLALIIKCFTPPSGDDNKDASKWLKQQKSIYYANLLDSTSALHADFKNMANRLKHDDSKIASASILNHNNTNVPGFYVQVATGKNDQRGPAPDIHKKYKNTVSTAFSYNHTILRSIGHVVNCTNRLNKIIFKNKKPVSHPSFSSFFSLLQIGFKVDVQFFPDEYERPYAHIVKNGDNFNVEYNWRYKKSPREDFERIKSFSVPANFNQRTSASHIVIPYLPLMYPERLAKS
ncbi:MAG: hypothetical protein Q8R51_02020 [Azonexus sp.]|nr:hypothetical protein [Azonexus sp.]